MCGGGGQQPDPTATANSQNAINNNAMINATRLSNINQTGPLGSVNYSGEPGSSDYTQNTTLTPQLQSILSSIMGSGEKVAGQIPATPFDLSKAYGGADVGSGAVPIQTQTYYAPITDTFNQGGAMQYNIADAGAIQNQIGDAGAVQRSLGDYSHNIQSGINTSGVNSLNTDFSNQLNSSRQAAYDSQAQFLDPRFGREQQAMESQLAAQGIPVGSEAYKNAMAQFGETKNQAYQGAADAATLAGNQLQNQLFGQNLSANQTQFGQAATQAQFGNTAQQQSYEQALGSGQFGNDAQQQYFSQLAARGQFANNAQAQQFDQNAQRQAANNATAGQAYAQNYGAAQFANDANTSRFGQNQAVTQFANNANQQKFDNNQILRNQGINEQQLVNNAPINELMALLNGTSIANVQFQPHAGQSAAQAAPDAVGLSASNYQAQQQRQAAVLSSIFSSIGRVGSSAVAACWVAREVYGEENSRWRQFRQWLFLKSPAWFFRLYLNHGERFAAWIRNKPTLKALIRRWMDSRIAAHV